MAIQPSSRFYKKTIKRFQDFVADPVVFPVMLTFLQKAVQNKENYASARSLLSDEKEFLGFYNSVRADLTPEWVASIIRQEADIREKIDNEVSSRIQKWRQENLPSLRLEAELEVRKEYEEQNKKDFDSGYSNFMMTLASVIGKELETHAKLEQLKTVFAEESRRLKEENSELKKSIQDLQRTLNEQMQQNILDREVSRKQGRKTLLREASYFVLSAVISVTGGPIIWTKYIEPNLSKIFSKEIKQEQLEKEPPKGIAPNNGTSVQVGDFKNVHSIAETNSLIQQQNGVIRPNLAHCRSKHQAVDGNLDVLKIRRTDIILKLCRQFKGTAKQDYFVKAPKSVKPSDLQNYAYQKRFRLSAVPRL